MEEVKVEVVEEVVVEVKEVVEVEVEVEVEVVLLLLLCGAPLRAFLDFEEVPLLLGEGDTDMDARGSASVGEST